MHLVAFVSNHESLDNCVDALRLIAERGGKCEFVCVAPPGGALPAAVARHGLPCRVVAGTPGAAVTPAIRGTLRDLARTVVSEDPDIFFHCDSQQSPADLMTALLREAGFKGLIIGGQGRFALAHVDELHADRMLCYGDRSRARLSSRHQASAYAAGLPRLDRLKQLPVSQGGYGVFLAHRSPEAPFIDASLAAFEQFCKVPVVVRAHPDYPGIYRHQTALPLPASLGQSAGWSTTEYLQHCNFVLATDATAALDALYLDKLVVLLPNAGLPVFDRYPGISEGFSAAAISDAARRAKEQPHRVAEFLRETVGGVRHDHAEGFFTALTRLVGSGPLRKVSRQPVAPVVLPVATDVLPPISTRVELMGFLPAGGRAAELGVAKGAFSDEMLRARDDIHLYSIDRWAGDRGHDSVEYTEACALLGAHGVRSTVVKKSFDEALADFAPDSLDLIYIDGYAHDGQQGGKTLGEWWSRVKPGGIFAGHDYHPDWKPTMDAVDGFCRAHGLQLQLTTGDFFPSWYVRKPSAATAAKTAA